ncbi:hypothetical protein [Haloplanus sp. C73]|uniref:hypothetical protein n=1 Tax=Haloplanus sp. C73 TaxID=3421641 RepID=UPI003EB73FB1
MVSSERLVWALVLAAVPATVALLLSPPNLYAWAVVGGATFVAAFPVAYLLAGLF